MVYKYSVCAECQKQLTDECNTCSGDKFQLRIDNGGTPTSDLLLISFDSGSSEPTNDIVFKSVQEFYNNLGTDIPKNDKPCLIISRASAFKNEILKVFVGDEAIDIYRELTTKEKKRWN